MMKPSSKVFRLSALVGIGCLFGLGLAIPVGVPAVAADGCDVGDPTCVVEPEQTDTPTDEVDDASGTNSDADADAEVGADACDLVDQTCPAEDAAEPEGDEGSEVCDPEAEVCESRAVTETEGEGVEDVKAQAATGPAEDAAGSDGSIDPAKAEDSPSPYPCDGGICHVTEYIDDGGTSFPFESAYAYSFEGGGTITIPANVSFDPTGVQRLSLTGGTTLKIEGPATLGGPPMDFGPGTTLILDGPAKNVFGNPVPAEGTLEIGGTLTSTNGSGLWVYPSGSLLIKAGASLIDEGTEWRLGGTVINDGTLQINSSDVLSASSLSITNNGDLTFGKDASADMQGSITNSGSITVAGRLENGGTLTSSGSLTIASGGTLSNSGIVFLKAGTVTHDGSIQNYTGYFYSAVSFVDQDGTFVPALDDETHGALFRVTVQAQPDDVGCTVSGTPVFAQKDPDGQDNYLPAYHNFTASLVCTDSVYQLELWEVSAYAQLFSTTDPSVQVRSDRAPVVLTARLEQAPKESCDDVAKVCNVWGSQELPADFEFKPDYKYVFKSGSSITIDAGASFDAGVTAGIQIEDGASLTINGSATLPSGPTDVQTGGKLTLNGDTTNPGELTNQGTLEIGGKLSNTGTLANQTGAELTVAADGEVVNDGAITNQGTATNGGTVTSTGSINNAGPLTNTGTIFNKSGQLSNTGPVDNSTGHVFSRTPVVGDGSFKPSPGDVEHGILLYYTLSVDPDDAAEACSVTGTGGAVPADPAGESSYVPMGGELDVAATCDDPSWVFKRWTLAPLVPVAAAAKAQITPYAGEQFDDPEAEAAVVDQVVEPLAVVAHFVRLQPPGPGPTPGPGPNPAPNPGPNPNTGGGGLPYTGPSGPVWGLATTAVVLLLIGATALGLARRREH